MQFDEDLPGILVALFHILLTGRAMAVIVETRSRGPEPLNLNRRSTSRSSSLPPRSGPHEGLRRKAAVVALAVLAVLWVIGLAVGFYHWMLVLIAAAILWTLGVSMRTNQCPRCGRVLGRKTVSRETSRVTDSPRTTEVRYIYMCRYCGHVWYAQDEFTEADSSGRGPFD